MNTTPTGDSEQQRPAEQPDDKPETRAITSDYLQAVLQNTISLSEDSDDADTALFREIVTRESSNSTDLADIVSILVNELLIRTFGNSIKPQVAAISEMVSNTLLEDPESRRRIEGLINRLAEDTGRSDQ